MLILNNVEVIYNNVILVLKGVSFQVSDGQIVSLLGANGAGKTTTLKAISGLLKSELGEVTDGSIEWNGKKIDRMNPEHIVKSGIAQVMEGRRSFQHLTTEENLKVGAHLSGRSNVKRDLDLVYGLFPKLKDLHNRTSGYLSGGEQQMMVIGRALMARPNLILLDEPSLGLAPLITIEIFETVYMINSEEKTSFVIVEQNANVALQVAHFGYVMENGRIVLEGEADKLAGNEDVREFYMGLGDLGQRKSYREVKHYKRRKRWLA